MQKPAKANYINKLFQIPIRSGDQETVDEEPLPNPIYPSFLNLSSEWVKQI